jgi:hypothetical protein
MGLVLGACSEDTPYDATDRAARGVQSELEAVDAALLRAGGFSFFRGSKDAFEQTTELRSPIYEGGRWTFETDGLAATFAFSDVDGVAQREPDHDTDRMQIELTETKDRVFGFPAHAVAEYRSTTTGLQTHALSISMGHAQESEFEIDEEGIVVRIGGRQDADATVTIVDRGPDRVPRYCPQGEVRGRSRAWGEAATPDLPWGRIPDETAGSATFEFEAYFEGRELVWQMFANEELIDEGRALTSFAEGC